MSEGPVEKRGKRDGMNRNYFQSVILVCVVKTSQGQRVDSRFLCELTPPPCLSLSVSRCSRMQGVLPVCGARHLLTFLLLQTAVCGESSLNWKQSPEPHKFRWFHQTFLEMTSADVWAWPMCNYSATKKIKVIFQSSQNLKENQIFHFPNATSKFKMWSSSDQNAVPYVEYGPPCRSALWVRIHPPDSHTNLNAQNVTNDASIAITRGLIYLPKALLALHSGRTEGLDERRGDVW